MTSNFNEFELGEVLQLKRGYDLPTDDRTSGPIPIVSSSGITGSHIEAKVEGPGVVTGRYGTLGKVFYVDSDFWPLNTALYVEDFKGNIPKFIYYFMKTLEFENQNAAGAVPGVNRNHLHKMMVRFPDLKKQKQIATILSKYDEHIENNLNRIEVLEQMVGLLYQEWFVHHRFPGYEEVEMVDSPRGEIPATCEVTKLGEICYQVRDSVHSDEVDQETPYIGLGHMPKKSVALTDWGCANEVSSRKYRFERGDILFGKIRPYFHKVGIAPIAGIASTDAIIIRPETEELYGIVVGCVSSEEFVAHATKSSSGTKMPRANWDAMCEYKIVLPPQSIQTRFTSIIKNISGFIVNLIHQNNALSQARELLRTHLISNEADIPELTTNKE